MRDGPGHHFDCDTDTMKVGFYLSEIKSANGYVLADAMVRSIRAAMPGVEVFQFSNESSGILHGVSGYFRKEGKNTKRLRLEHYAAEGEWLFIDTDCWVQGDLRDVFNREFDIAIANRDGSLLDMEVGSNFMLKMPHNLGVVFSRCPEFWSDALATWEAYEDRTKEEIWSDQLAVCDTIKAGKFNVLVLDGGEFNLSPKKRDQFVDGAKVLHYKGARKTWMLERAMLEFRIYG
jgi:hypothetical protein